MSVTLYTDREGDCETCGRWDSHLIDGVCQECAKRYQIEQEIDEDYDDE